MSLVDGINALSTRIANHFRDAIVPRLIPGGGTLGQILRKASSLDYQVQWHTLPTFGTAASSATTDFATASQGALAATALQDEDVGTAAYLNITPGTSAPSSPAVGDVWLDTNPPAAASDFDGGTF